MTHMFARTASVFAFLLCSQDLLACNVSGSTPDAPMLCGRAVQGGMIYGQVSGWDVYRIDEKSGRDKISNDGVFVVGLDRDARKLLTLSFCRTDGDKKCNQYAYNIEQRKYHEQHVSVPDKFVKYPDEVQKRIDKENADIKRQRARAADADSLEFMNFKLSKELSKFPVSSVFGSRRVFNGEPKSPHKGIDIAAPAGTHVSPIASGTVVIATDMYMSGNTVFVTHGHGVTSAYLHMETISVKIGDTVTPETLIGTVGSTGRSSGAHLHLGIYWRQIALDPEVFIKAGDAQK